jgi:hypothetical protein
VYWAAAYAKGGQPEAAEGVTPIIGECKKGHMADVGAVLDVEFGGRTIFRISASASALATA